MPNTVRRSYYVLSGISGGTVKPRPDDRGVEIVFAVGTVFESAHGITELGGKEPV